MSQSWGLVATLKAAPEAVLDFVAWHLELGAAHLYLYIDDPKDPVYSILQAIPKVSAILCDDAHWGEIGRRPRRHQPRQTANATQAYQREAPLDWLAHIDVDEFLMPQGDLGAILSTLPPDCQSARIRPMEALAPSDPAAPQRFKRFSHAPKLRQAQTARIYPEYGPWLNGGFLSHVAGKLFVRPGIPGAEFRIHNLLTEQGQNPGQRELDRIALGHFHASDRDAWLAHFHFRLSQGAYRTELKPAKAGQETLHGLLTRISQTRGDAGLIDFFEATCRDTPALRGRLDTEGLLAEARMDFAALRDRYFPAHTLPETLT
ncbi:glycosyltransferase family 2 protein [Pseudooceanicola algae]|uniref:Glycosyl transferase family 2 n=1 Tax=Pseudooceanicola algae TaxID=1537215 RepID=A0A418SF43_9RHOB|nr:glycosyltransferase family 2 protein [Pseudooceanicola algae]QPM89293.1 hypothetical protein PSAL_005080 [Pseudooceanicola algae]